MKGIKQRLVKFRSMALVLALGISILTACAAPVQTETVPPATTTTQAPTPISTPANASTVPPVTETTPATPEVTQTTPVTFPLTITDQLGRTVTIKKMPERIVSLSPANTEILFALGLGGRVVGVDQYSDYPPEAKTKPIIGGFSNPDYEKIIELNPDLILASDIHKDQAIPYLEQYFSVVALGPTTVDQVLDSIKLVGGITGEQTEAGQLVSDLGKRIKAVTDKTANLSQSERPKVFYVVWPDPLMSAGKGTFQADLIQKAGGANVAGGTDGWATISLESVVAANPDIIVTDDQGMSTGGSNLQYINSEPGLANTAALKTEHVYTVPTELISHPGPRLVDALEQFAKIIHPELFK